MNEHEPSEPLAQLQRAIVDEATLGQLFFDIAELAELFEVVVKAGATAHVTASERVSLAEAHQRLARGEVVGVQLRYRYQGSEWWDTLSRAPYGIELVRIEHRR